MPQMNSPITTVSAGPEALPKLIKAVDLAKTEDRFARVVIIADHHDAARSVRHHLGSRGLINVTVQTGRRLAGELAKPDHKPLPRHLEIQAVRWVAEGKVRELGLDPVGQRRFYRSLITAFREMQERHDAPGDGVAIDEMNRLAQNLHNEFLEEVRQKGYYTAAELPQMGAGALDALPGVRTPTVIYYLPRRMSDGDLRLAHALLERGKCRVIAGFTHDAPADRPVNELLARLGHQESDEADAPGAVDPLRRRAADGALSIVATPDPEEEIREVIRRITAGTAPFHRIAVIHRQDNPYASLLRQELDFAGIPFSGVGYRRLADTPTGLLLMGLADLTASTNAGSGNKIDRERLIEWLTAAPVRLLIAGDTGNGQRRAPGAAWAKLAREARANGGIEDWRRRLHAYLDHVGQREKDLGNDDGEDNALLRDLAQRINGLLAFLEALVGRLGGFAVPAAEPRWESVSEHLKETIRAYRWLVADEVEEDRRQIEELVDGLAELDKWGVEYSPEALQETVQEILQTPVSERGRPVGAGVYIGPPAGMAGAAYDTVYAVGMVERQFPPRPQANPWLTQDVSELQRAAELERYDFLCAIASAGSAVLSWPAATEERSIAYPSRWLIEAANHLHHQSGRKGRLTHENLTAAAAGKVAWLTVIESREARLRNPAHAEDRVADELDYNLMHLVCQPAETLRHHQAIASDPRMVASLEARAARNGDRFSEWDGIVGAESVRISGIGRQERPISPSALETWATCPYKYFLSLVLRLSDLPDEEGEVSISALERGSLVHRVLERFVKEKNDGDEAALLRLANEEFKNAEVRGVTGHYLLWEIAKDNIRAALQAFLTKEREWLHKRLGSTAADQVHVEVGFGPPSRRRDQPTELGEVHVEVDGLDEPVWFSGRIDRIDQSGGKVLVRDFKTGRSSPYTSGGKDAYTVVNGRALQLPVYVEALKIRYSDADFVATYCFPLQEPPLFEGRAYSVEGEYEHFRTTLKRIIGAAGAGVFPATPDPDSERGNCRYCDFKRLCPVRRRQIWERKAVKDAETVKCFNALGGPAAVVTQ